MKFVRMLTILLLVTLSLSAAITATYDPEPVLFFEPSSSPLPANRLIAKLGTLTIDTGGDSLFDPTLLSTNMSTEYSFMGPITQSSGSTTYSNETSQFNLYAVSTAKGETQANCLEPNADNYHQIRTGSGGRGNLQTNPFIVYFYVVSELSLPHFKLGSLYTLTGGSLGDFQVAVATQGSGYPKGGENISVNGAPPESNTPILSPGSSSSDPTIIYGDPSDQVLFFLTIKDQQIITLAQATGNSKTKVAVAEMDIINGVSGVQYAVDVIFTNLANTNPFELVWQGTECTPPPIPYYLFFNEYPVTPGDSVPWNGLVNGPQSKNIFVTGVDEDDIQQALSGHYEDTIVVNIVPVD